MKQAYTDQKYVIAWFKIAEYVNRGEKERALGVYQLLSHSIDDQALALQIKGDILYACNDQRCIEIYEKTVESYLQQKKLMQAAVVLEQIVLIDPTNTVSIGKLIELYRMLEKYDIAYQHVEAIIQLHINKGSILQAYEICQAWISLFSQIQQFGLYALFLHKEYEQNVVVSQLQESMITKMVELAKLDKDESTLLQQLRGKLARNVPSKCIFLDHLLK